MEQKKDKSGTYPMVIKPRISVIIPVYNVEKYIQQCLDSVISQTYRNLEILLINDGSTDDSKCICDEYAAIDDRITVYNIANSGLSFARNYGLDHCTGDYIAFLDSDDWMEENAIDLFVSSILSVDADIAVCSYDREYLDHREHWKCLEQIRISQGNDIIQDYLSGYGIGNIVWNKLYKVELFNNIRFPEGRLFEDIATTYKLLSTSKRLVVIPKSLIHYRARQDSIAQTHSLKSLTDGWKSYQERYDALVNRFYDYKVVLMSDCLRSIGRFWRWYFGCAEKDSGDCIKEMQRFVLEHEHDILNNNQYSWLLKFYCFITRFPNPFVFGALYTINHIYRLFYPTARMYE